MKRPPYPETFVLIPLHRWDTKDANGKPVGKAPLHQQWTTRDYTRDAALAAASRGFNLGVRLEADQLVVDVDPRNGGTEGFDALCIDLGIDPDTWPHVRTGSGGSHYYLRKPADVLIRDTLKEYPGVEFKSKGRQVVAAGSRHPNGEFYKLTPDRLSLLKLPDVPNVLLERIRRPDRSGESVGGGQASQEDIAKALGKLDPTKFQDHDAWLRLMMACHHASNGDGRQEFIDWSVSDPEFAEHGEQIGRRWDSLHNDKMDGITYRTLNHILRESGAINATISENAADDFEDVDGLPALPRPDPLALDEEPETEESKSDDMLAVDERGFKINRNSVAADSIENTLFAVVRSGIAPSWDELKQNVVFRTDDLPWHESYGRVLTDQVLHMIRLIFINKNQHVAFSPSKENVQDALMTIAFSAKFNPVLEYMDGLTWDGTPRVANLFGNYFNCGDDAYTRAVSTCLMVGAVRRMRQPGCKFDTMPILRSPQGWNKSTAVRKLFGDVWYSDADLGPLNNKDAALLLRGIWVQEFAEIDSLSRANAGILKAFCSRATDRQRNPYGRVVQDTPRRCVFIATVNEGGYLKDSTGARRFWPLEVGAPIAVARIVEDRDQLWAEAAALEAQGVSEVLPRELWAVAAERQAGQTSEDPWADLIREFLDHRASAYEANIDNFDMEELPAPPPDKVHTTELYDALEIPKGGRTSAQAQRLRTVMESVIGWKARPGVRLSGNIRRGYIQRRR